MDEQELIASSQAGDLDSFNSLVERYQQQVFNLSYRMLGNVQAAEDATQDTFLSAYRALRQFKGGSFKAWLLRIAANACHDQQRASWRRPATSLDSLPYEPQAQPVLTEPDESPEDYALRRELRSYINQGLAALSEDQRLVVVLADIQGLSYEEIAEATASSLGTVKSRLSRGRTRLRDFLLRQQELLPRRFRHT